MTSVLANRRDQSQRGHNRRINAHSEQPLADAAWLKQLVMHASIEGALVDVWACAAMAAAARTVRVFMLNIVGSDIMRKGGLYG